MKIRSSGVVKLSFNGKSRNTSLFTYNLQKETQEQLDQKLREKIVDFFSFYSEFANKTPIKNFEVYSADYICTNNCKFDMMTTKVSCIGNLYPFQLVKKILEEEGKRFNIPVEFSWP